MNRREVPLLLILGLSIWILGTICCATIGPAILETSGLRYWCSFALSPILSALLCAAIVRWRHIEPEQWASAILLLAIPGMIGEAAVLSNLSVLMPDLHAASGGKYGACLFAMYGFVLGMAEAVTLRAAPRAAS